jgi:hypothetical protein
MFAKKISQDLIQHTPMLWLKFVFGLKIFTPICITFSFVASSLSYFETKENKNEMGF